ncbi:MAG: DUF4019 domain-containing protein [Pseudomonadota bacterium]
MKTMVLITSVLLLLAAAGCKKKAQTAPAAQTTEEAAAEPAPAEEKAAEKAHAPDPVAENIPDKAGKAPGPNEKAAVEAAEAWLVLVDEGKFGDSWDEAAKFFKSAVKKEQWAQQVKMARPPFGEALSREVVGAEYMTSVPGAPDGEYVVIVFKTKFKNKDAAFETITPMMDDDGVWRVSGYYIK